MSQVRCYCNLYLLSFIVTMYLTKFLYEQYSNSRFLIHYIEVIILLYFLCQVVISYSAILIVFCTFKFSSMTLLSLSLYHVRWILCYRIKNISFLVFIKQLKPRIFVKVRVVGSNPLPGTGSFFSSFLFLHLFPSFPYTARLPRCMRVCGQSPARLSSGPSYHRLQP